MSQRTLNQNAAMHKYFTEIADLCMATGTDIKVLIEDIEITPSMETIKIIWRAISKEKFGVESTADQETWQVKEVYEEFNRLLGKHGLHIPFPSSELEDQQ